MRKSVTAVVAAGALGLASVSATQPAHAMDPWTAAAWFIGGMFVGGAIIAPAYARSAYGYATYGYAPYGYASPYAYSGPYTYAPVYNTAWATPRCYATQIRRGSAWYPARVCY